MPTLPMKDGEMGGSLDELTSSDEYSQESRTTPGIARSVQQVTSHDLLNHEKGQSFSRGERSVSVVGSPNFVYLNAAYSSSVEVLPALYAKVDLSKKTKNKKAAERPPDTALTHTRRQSKSSDNILSGSPKFTHFAAFAADTECKGYEDAFISMIPPQKPCTERISWARTNSVEQSDVKGERAECVTNLPTLPEKKGSYRGQVEVLKRTLTEVSHIKQEEQ